MDMERQRIEAEKMRVSIFVTSMKVVSAKIKRKEKEKQS
jgi:hypothetical protein